MKNVKYIVFGIFICLLLLFILSGVLSHFYRNSTIHMKEYDNYEESIELLSNKINKVKDDDCKI
ncbi:MAG: hypothetical protein K5666_01845, partial [Bacilli bacterium]|nr:hypothetical protein [Bacilli bacterium]